MSNTVCSIVSCHEEPLGGKFYRFLHQNGGMAVKSEAHVRSMVRGDLAIENYDPHVPIENPRGEPLTMHGAPCKGDLLLVSIEGRHAVCEVLDVTPDKRKRPLFKVKYDDGMLIQDYLRVPWTYLSCAPPAADAVLGVAALAALGKPAADPQVAPVSERGSQKATGKRKAVDAIEAAPISPPLSTPPPASLSAMMREALSREKRYADLLDSMIM